MSRQLIRKTEQGYYLHFLTQTGNGLKKSYLNSMSRQIPPFLSSLVFPLQAVILCLFFIAAGGGLAEGTERASDYGEVGTGVLWVSCLS